MSACCCPMPAARFVTFFGLHAFGRVPAMLNFSTGAANMAAACAAAEVKTIVTSRRFVEAGDLDDDLALLAEARRHHLSRGCARHDRRSPTSSMASSPSLFRDIAAAHGAAAIRDPNAPAVILFTSGSEGVPKGVVLSHRNLQANRFQAAARIDFTAQDIVFNALPMFHAFGLTGGTLLPVLSGVRTFLYPSPLHYKIIPELAYDTNATILFGTDTFLMGYARNAHPYDFYNVRFVVAGAERVQARDARDLDGEIRHAHSRRLWRHRMLAGARRQHADAFQVGHRRPPARPASSTASIRSRASPRAAGSSSKAPTSCWAICAPIRRA